MNGTASNTPRFTEHASHVDVIVRAVVASVSPRRCVAERAPEELRGRRCRMIAAGKASAAMAAGLLQDVGAEVVEGLIVGPPGTGERARAQTGGTAGIESLDADHPLPTERNVNAAHRAASLAVRCSADGVPLVALLSGGASAYLSLPRVGVSLEELSGVTLALLRGGASIHELNTVRKHLEQLKGGGLARLAAPAPIDALVLSDVVGDDPAVIASGPFSPDAGTPGDAIDVLRRFGAEGAFASVVRVLRRAEADGREHPGAGDVQHRTPMARTTIVGSNTLALDAAVRVIESIGFAVVDRHERVQGEAGVVGRALGERVRSGASIGGRPWGVLVGGETTVRVTGTGRGGRNQELALAAALAIRGLPRRLVASFATDGIDGPTDAAGAYATGETCDAAARRGLDPSASLDRHDSHPFFEAMGSLIRTGWTGTNVNDIAVGLTYQE